MLYCQRCVEGTVKWIENGAAFEFEPMDSCPTNKCPVLRKWQQGTVTEIRTSNDCSHNHHMICQQKCQAQDECKFFSSILEIKQSFCLAVTYFQGKPAHRTPLACIGTGV